FDATPATPNVIGSIADITGHSYVALAAGNANIEIDNTRLVGFVRGITSGASTITAQVTGIAATQSLPVSVINWYGAPSNLLIPGTATELNAIVDPVGTSAGDPDNFPNILFLAEGFTQAQQPLFDQLVTEITNRMFTGPRYRPFCYLRGDVNTWKAFTPSAQRGFTNTSYRDLHVSMGPPVFTSIFSNPKNTITQGIDSFYGFINPRRPCDNIYSDSSHLVGDIRRYGLHLDWHESVMRFIGTLALRSTPASRIGRHWSPNGSTRAKDEGLVCIIYNDRTGGREANYLFFTLVPTSFMDPPPRISDSGYYLFDPPRPVSGAVTNPLRWRVSRDIWPFDATAVTADKVDSMCDTLTHELGHSLVLGDEYEEISGAAAGVSAHRMDNLTFLDLIHHTTGTPNEIDPSRLVWASLHRVSRSDRIISATWNLTNVNAITAELRIAPASVSQWPTTTPVFIREFRRNDWFVTVDYGGIHIRNTMISTMPRAGEDPLVVLETISISAADATTGVLTISVPKAKFPAAWQALPDPDFRTRVNGLNWSGALLFLPLVRDGVTLKLADSEVMQFMTTNHMPLTNNRSGAGVCGTASATADNPPGTVINTTLRNLPTHTFRIIGAYEGGDHNTCTVYRPTGFCRMRNSSGMPDGSAIVDPAFVSEFCYVCQYLIINRINPAKLVLLEANYPEFTPVTPPTPPTPPTP
ncbi:MAG TPA: hypothetical protein VK826_10250, partial [Bacteroidia bacterium]|nr:hypothetical protein [Bacteroidia bacterium]